MLGSITIVVNAVTFVENGERIMTLCTPDGNSHDYEMPIADRAKYCAALNYFGIPEWNLLCMIERYLNLPETCQHHPHQ